ncbi:MAG: MTAP family purine nucleoside phosphorylase [Magnetococcales bacterium]|nr:MTAP family purine nucleoside phosphorylase [Magnetococcales bacterium]
MHPFKLAVIGGTSLLESDLFKDAKPITVATEHGSVTLMEQGDTVFLQRHGLKEYTPPHMINHHANLSALNEVGVSNIISVGSVGGLRMENPPGTVLIPDDFFAPHLAPTFFSDTRGHIAPGFDASWRQKLLDALGNNQLINPVDGGVYWQTIGPRFETPAEIAFYQPHFHVVGMTVASECILASECQIPYAAICMIDNYANGVSDEELTFESFKKQVRTNEDKLVSIIELLMERLIS